MKLRSLDQDDIPQLLALYRHLDPHDNETTLEVARDRWEQLKRFPGGDIIVGCLGEDIVASCTLVVIPNMTRGGLPYALIENVVTDSNYRNRGFGKAVLGKAVSSAWDAGCYKVMLLTGSKKPETLKFYENAGFEQNKTGFQIRRIAPRSE